MTRPDRGRRRFLKILGAMPGMMLACGAPAVLADAASALSTGLSLMPVEAIAPLARRLRVSVYLNLPDGGEKTLNVA